MATQNCTGSEKFVVFVDEKFASDMSVADCMSALSRPCAEASTFFGAVEKFSDFTLRAVPEMIFVAVSSLPKRLKDLERATAGTVDGANLRVFGLDGDRKRRGQNVVHSLNQLEEIIGTRSTVVN